METRSIVTIFLLLGLYALLGLWHSRENKEIINALSRKLDETTAQDIARFIKMRTYQLMGITALCILVIIGLDQESNQTYDKLIELTEATKERQLLEQKKAEQARLAAEQQKTATTSASVATATPTALELLASAPPAPPMPLSVMASTNKPRPQPVKSAAPPSTPAPSADTKDLAAIDLPESPLPIQSASPTANAAESALTDGTSQQEIVPASEAEPEQITATDSYSTSEAALNSSFAQAEQNPQQDTIDRVYNPERADALQDDQSGMDDIKKRYEDILVLYLYMKKCGRAKPTDYNIITSALAQEMAAVNAPGKLHNDIVESAQGSFQEIYAESACEGEGVGRLNQQYSDYITTLQENFSPQ